MNYFGRIISNLSQVYSEINPATLTGAIDVIIVEQEDGSYACSPFHVRFGKIGVLRSREKIVDIEINGEPVDLHMKLGDSGEAYFVEEVDSNDEDADDGVDDEHHFRSTNNSESSVNTSTSSSSQSVKNSDNEHRPDVVITIPEEKDEQQPEVALFSMDSSDADNNHCDNINSTQPQQQISVKDPEDSKHRRVKRKKKSARSKLSANRSSEGNLEALNKSEMSPKEVKEVKGQPEDELHPFSDSEISVLNASHAKMVSRGEAGNDCKSDSEYEIYKSSCDPDKQCDKHPPCTHHDTISWNWGELPQNVETSGPSQTSTPLKKAAAKELASESTSDQPDAKGEKPSKLSRVLGVFSGSGKPKTETNPEEKGIYLDSLNPEELNPEVAAKYFPSIPGNGRSSLPEVESEEYDHESGKGSLSASPQSCSEFNFDSRDSREIFPLDKAIGKFHDLSMSLCGRVEELQDYDSTIFLDSLVRFEDFIQRPEEILQNPNLVIRFGGKYYSWRVASAILMSFMAFQRELPEATIDNLKQKSAQNAQNSAGTGSGGWTSWWRSKEQKDLKNTISAEHSYAKPPPQKATSGSDRAVPKVSKPTALGYTSDDDTINIMLKNDVSTPKADKEAFGKLSGTTSGPEVQEGGKKPKVKFRKTLTLKPDVIRSLNLKPNGNEIAFSVTTAFQGTTVSRSNIYLWKWSDKIIISDIDGTITRSDVLGHVLPYFGKDWAQAGVTQLFTNIESNGYKFLYLSARAIGQAKTTRDYLRDLKQEDLGLPDGPLLLSPTSLFSALHREVIEKKPEEFKISCLKNIQSLFPQNPFFAGFGNKINDNWAYKAVGIDLNRIFTINPKGELKLERIMDFRSSYADLSQLADQMFPPVEGYSRRQSTSGVENTDFSDFMYWRPDIAEPSLEDIRKISTGKD